MTVRTFLLSVGNEQLEVCTEAVRCLMGHSANPIAVPNDLEVLAVLIKENRVFHNEYMILADYTLDQDDIILALKANIKAQGLQIKRYEAGANRF